MEELFNNLCTNAFSFLKKSMQEIKKDPKFSAVNFCIGIELLLKARLAHDHEDSIFISGGKRKKTIGLEDLLKKIKKEKLEKNILEELIKNIIKLKTDRDNIVHFYSEDFLNVKRDLMAADQFSIWGILSSILGTTWKDIFKKYKKDIDDITYHISKYDEFFQKIYETLKNSIIDEIKTGADYKKCHGCSYISAKYKKIVIYDRKQYYLYSCVVCGCNNEYCQDYVFSIPCPFCKNIYKIYSNDIPVCVDSSGKCYSRIGDSVIPLISLAEGCCQNCGDKITTSLIIKECLIQYQDNSDEEEPCAWCCNCQYEEPSVFRINEEWICVVCFEQGWSAITCPHCEKFVYGDACKIKYYACAYCEE